jgi:hypothetical protein
VKPQVKIFRLPNSTPPPLRLRAFDSLQTQKKTPRMDKGTLNTRLALIFVLRNFTVGTWVRSESGLRRILPSRLKPGCLLVEKGHLFGSYARCHLVS